VWEIFAYQNSDSLFGIFNAVAGIFSSGTYISGIAIAVVSGFIAAGIAYAFAPERLQGWKWLASVTLIYSIMLVPKVTVGIVDKTGGGPVKVVANVPLGLAFFGSLTSSVGNTLTELFETAFQTIPGPGALAAEMAYQRNGLMFGNRVVRATRNVNVLDPALRTDLVNFIANCTTYDLLDGTINPVAFTTSDNIWALMATPNPARFTTIATSSGAIDAVVCPNAYASLSARMPGAIASLQTRLALELHPTLPPVMANAQIQDEIEAAYRGRLADVSKTATDLLYQNALINAVGDASSLMGQKINDPAGTMLSFARAQAVAQQNASWLNGAKIAEQSVPIVRNVVEAITYAMFPLFVLLLLLTSGRDTMVAIKAYVSVLIWIQLWPPLYAILNYMGTVYASFDLGAAADLGFGARALALRNAMTIYGNAISGEAVVSSLMVLIPFVTWAAVKRLETFGAALVSGLSDLRGSAGGAAASGAIGNYGAGNAMLEQRTVSPLTSDSFMAVTSGPLGTSTRGLRRGEFRFRENLSSLATRFAFSESDAAQMSETAAKHRAFGTAQREASLSATSSALVQAMGLHSSYERETAQSQSKGYGSSGGSSKGIDVLSQVATQINDRLGLDRESGAGKQVAAAIAAGVQPSLSATASVAGRSFEQSKFNDAVNWATSTLSSQGVRNATQVLEEFRSGNAYEWGTRSRTAATRALDSAYRSAIEHQIAADKTFMTAEQIGTAAAFMREASMNVTSDASNFLVSRLERTGQLDEFLRADPITQKQMAYDIAREYGRGSPGIDGLHVPRSSLERPTTPAELTGLESALSERFKMARLPVPTRSPSTADATNAGYVLRSQRASGVDPQGSISRDAAEVAERREADAKGEVAAHEQKIAESAKRQKETYRDRTIHEAQSTLTGGGLSPDVVREVTRPNRSSSGTVSEEE
jgi:conjugal transfer mating pair stabilization protein TraG